MFTESDVTSPVMLIVRVVVHAAAVVAVSALPVNAPTNVVVVLCLFFVVRCL